jgi:prepilin-type N-terminal cleavage/methylation domain-containing protein
MLPIAFRSPASRAFTLIELLVVIAVLGILSIVAIPRYIDYTARAREATVRGVLGNVRSAIGNFYANSSLDGASAFPTLVQLQTAGTVMMETIPANPYNSSATISTATWAATPPTSGSAGWNYDPVSGRFWANTTDAGSNTW